MSIINNNSGFDYVDTDVPSAERVRVVVEEVNANKEPKMTWKEKFWSGAQKVDQGLGRVYEKGQDILVPEGESMEKTFGRSMLVAFGGGAVGGIAGALMGVAIVPSVVLVQIGYITGMTVENMQGTAVERAHRKEIKALNEELNWRKK